MIVREALWKRCGSAVEALWKRCGNAVEALEGARRRYTAPRIDL
jgi:hypothetical protein